MQQKSFTHCVLRRFILRQFRAIFVQNKRTVQKLHLEINKLREVAGWYKDPFSPQQSPVYWKICRTF